MTSDVTGSPSPGTAPPPGPDAPVPPRDPAAESRRRGFPPWAIVAIVLIVVVGQVVVLGLLARASVAVVESFQDGAGEDSWYAEGDEDWVQGAVLDPDGQEVTDGTGEFDRPARPGTHSLVWPTEDGGILEVAVSGASSGAELPDGAGAIEVRPGYSLVRVDAEVRYTGDGSYSLADDLWFSVETDEQVYDDVLAGLVPGSLAEAPELSGGDSADVTLGFLIAEEELGSAALVVETWDGEPLFYDVR